MIANKKTNLLIQQLIALTFLLSLFHFSFALAETQQLLEGKKLYETGCIMCHGVDARATGPLAQKSNPPTPDLTSCVYQKKLAEGAVISSVVLMPAGTLMCHTVKITGHLC